MEAYARPDIAFYGQRWSACQRLDHMSAAIPTLTCCNRTGCQQMTPNTFCSRECRRLASIGRTCHRAQTSSGVTGTDENYVSRAEWLCVRAVTMVRDGTPDNSGKRRWLAAKKRRDEAAERRQRRRKR